MNYIRCLIQYSRQYTVTLNEHQQAIMHTNKQTNEQATTQAESNYETETKQTDLRSQSILNCIKCFHWIKWSH